MFGFKKKQGGVISSTLIICLIVAVVAAGGAAWIQQQRIDKEVANTKLVQGKLDVANDSLRLSASANEGLLAEIKTWKDLAKVNAELATEHAKRADIIQANAAKQTKALPKVKPKSSEPVQSAEQIESSRLRSESIFQAFCSADPSNELCIIPATPEKSK